ncbi:hypothetical protein CY34DRAFT_797075 [Suillus luteus UH-Slu-Lm8-n1]|uniref:Uncharacterized protein n=1 Tax=Suillus luteus UH-Slu-Lm8-n1 TaxID=930992 RepID=A0A0D0BJC5_9AGAM|nr:hypothetical protein CY34DRAFT_797075 [Suillus luteus UH-Slu-Lm8-n1]
MPMNETGSKNRDRLHQGELDERCEVIGFEDWVKIHESNQSAHPPRVGFILCLWVSMSICKRSR